ncbi:MAG TPA: FG-GAP-like repeat-containing protein, partial [Chryseolinea sp.]|nr:FG-GAP-like repeat-containing protein [Chryseolinea sp.]
TRVVDSLEVIWPDGRRQQLKNINSNQLLNLNYNDSQLRPHKENQKSVLFTSAAVKTNIDFVHIENAFVDFKVQALLPQMHSRNGPGITVSDVNGDGLEDFFIGGAAHQAGGLFIQQDNGKFAGSPFLKADVLADNMGVLLFDADNDEDDDLYIVSGGAEEKNNSDAYLDHLYINDGKGNFAVSQNAIPDLRQSGSCVIACDYDKDGDLDLFVGGRIVPGEYPLPADSYILRNDSGEKGCIFTDVTNQLAPALTNLGLVTAALWTDVDGDGWTDLLIVGEFMPITYFKNKDGKNFERVENTSLSHTSGWWNSLTAGDYDQDGDTDYIAGNLGLNTRYRGNTTEPLCIYAKDYDKNGSIDPLMTYYLQGKKYLVHARDELISQISVMRLRFKKYQDYADVTFEESFLPSELEGAYVACSERFETSYLENNGNGTFNIRPLPTEVQFAPVYGMVSDDFNQDGFLDVLTVGNSYSTEVTTGYCDASVGLLLAGDGQGNFNPVTPEASGFYADLDAKGMALLTGKNGYNLLLVGNNSDNMTTYEVAHTKKTILIEKDDTHARIERTDGTIYKHEFYYGSTYLSQSSRQLPIPHDAILVQISDINGSARQISINPLSR